MTETEDETGVRISEDERERVRTVAGERDVDDLSEQEKNLAIAQAKLIGDI